MTYSFSFVEINHHKPKKAEIIECSKISHDKKYYKIKPSLDFNPGQFVEISVAGIGEFPVSIASPPYIKDYFEICIKKVGRVTSYLYNLKEGDFIGYRGPFGNGFPMEKIKGKNVVVIAGGIGIIPLRSLINETIKKKIHSSLKILYGASDPENMLFREEIREWRKHAEVMEVFERGGERTGLVSEFVGDADIKGDEYVFVCGPPAMFKPVGEKLIEHGIDKKNIFLSIERKMKCGVGKCGHCIFGGKYYACIDGPVFSYDKFMHATL